MGELYTFSGTEKYMGSLTNAYGVLAGRADNVQLMTAFTIIGAAGTAAGALSCNGSKDLIKAAALTAAGSETLASQFQPGKARDSFIAAAKRVDCIRQAATTARIDAGAYGDPLECNPIAVGIILNNISRVSLNLKSELSKNQPNLDGLFAAFQQFLKENITNKEKHKVKFFTANGIISDVEGESARVELTISTLKICFKIPEHFCLPGDETRRPSNCCEQPPGV